MWNINSFTIWILTCDKFDLKFQHDVSIREIKHFVYIFAKGYNPESPYRIVGGISGKWRKHCDQEEEIWEAMSAAPSKSGYAQPLDDNYSCGLFLPLSALSRRSRRSRERSVGCVLLVFRERRMFSQSSVDGKLPLAFAPEILTSRGQRTWICKTVLSGLPALLLSHLFCGWSRKWSVSQYMVVCDVTM